MKDYEKLSTYTDKLDIKTTTHISNVEIKRVKMKDGSIVPVNSIKLGCKVVDVEKERPSSYTEDDLLIK